MDMQLKPNDNIVIPRELWKKFHRLFTLEYYCCVGSLSDDTKETTLEWVRENMPNNLLDPKLFKDDEVQP
jgi:hypothetical protein